jgi:hypothetical protein
MSARSVATAGTLIAGLVALITGFAWLFFGALIAAVLTLLGFIGWHLFEPERTRAHTRYTTRARTRPRPASRWQIDERPIAPPTLPTRPDIVARPGRRMVALLDEDVNQASTG